MAIHVKDEIELYAAVKNVKNVGKKIVLAAGKYILDETLDGDNAGRLELLEGMSLQGQPGHPDLVVIDFSGLPDTSYAPVNKFPARTGAIRMGKGFNKMEWITVVGKNDQNNKVALSIIDTDLIGTGVSRIKIANCIISGGRIGINVRNVGVPSDGRKIEVELVNNEVYNNLVSDTGTQQGQGICIQHANGVSGASIRVKMNGNYVHDNIHGMRIFNNSNSKTADTNNNNITVISRADRFNKNKLGIYVGGGSNREATKTVNGNSISFEAHGTIIQNSRGINHDSITLPCGIFLSGGTSGLAGNMVSDNKIDMKLSGCTLFGNQGSDIIAFGAFTSTTFPLGTSPTLPPLPGTNNVVQIKRQGVSKYATLKTTDCFPPDPAHTNRVIVIN